MHIDLELPTECVAWDVAWIRVCAGRLRALDALIDPADAESIAAEMSRHDRWRALPPGVAATSLMFEAADGSALAADEDG